MRTPRVLVIAVAVAALVLLPAVASAQYPPSPTPTPPEQTQPFVPPPAPPQVTLHTPTTTIVIEGRRFQDPANRDDGPPAVLIVIREGSQAQATTHTVDVERGGSFTATLSVPQDAGEDLSVTVAGVGQDGAVHLLEGRPGDTVLSPTPSTWDKVASSGFDEAAMETLGYTIPTGQAWHFLLATVLMVVMAADLAVLVRRRAASR